MVYLLDAFKTAIKIKPDLPEAFYNLGNVHYTKNNTNWK